MTTPTETENPQGLQSVHNGRDVVDAQDTSQPHTGLATMEWVERRGAPTIPLEEPLQDRWLLLAVLAVLAGVSGVAYYLGFVRPYLLSEYYDTPLLDLAKINGHTPQSANAWAFTWVVLFVCYYLAFRLCPSIKNVSRAFRWMALALVVGWALLFSIQMVFMYPVGAADIFDQIFRARITHHYGLNPFITVPNSIYGDTFLRYVAWRDEGSPYGPVWELLSAGTGWLAGDSLWWNLIFFKVLVLVPYAASVALTYGILRTLKPEWALRGTLFFAWNPLVIFEIAGNGHNDAFVVMFLLLAVYFFVRASHAAVIPALMAGALTKFVPVLLVPVAAAAIWRDRVSNRYDGGPAEVGGDGDEPSRSFIEPLRALWIGGIVAIGMAVVLYAPFWEGPQSIGALGRQSLFTASLPKVLADWLAFDVGMGDRAAQSLVRYGALTLVGLVVVALSLRLFLGRNARTLDERHELVGRTLRSFYEIIFVYLAFATLWFQPWYLMWLIALTAPIASFTYAHRTLLFCISGVLNYFVWDYLWLWNRAPNREIQVTSALVVYTLPLAYTLYVWLRPLWKRDAPAATQDEVVRASTVLSS
ncbi:MAG TPA: hypothetical protein VJ183_14820 [Chloroflexia bacterium]|nr:hypothetical protein [Chloroflexia bacterium]